MGEYPSYYQDKKPSPEEEARRAARRERLEVLRNTVYTADQLLDLVDQNPEYKELLEKALVMVIAGNGHPENQEKIAAWPDAVNSDGYVDEIASLNQRVQKEGAKAIREFGDTKISVSDVMLNVESVSFVFRMASKEHAQLQDAVMKRNWHEQIENLLLQKNESPKE